MTRLLVCTKGGVHGKLWRVGDKTTAERLEDLGGFVPDYFVAEGTEEANEAELDADGSGYANKKEMRNYLKAKGVEAPAKATRDELQKMIDDLQQDPLI